MKRLLSIILAAVLLIAFSNCRDNPPPSDEVGDGVKRFPLYDGLESAADFYKCEAIFKGTLREKESVGEKTYYHFESIEWLKHTPGHQNSEVTLDASNVELLVERGYCTEYTVGEAYIVGQSLSSLCFNYYFPISFPQNSLYVTMNGASPSGTEYYFDGNGYCEVFGIEAGSVLSEEELIERVRASIKTSVEQSLKSDTVSYRWSEYQGISAARYVGRTVIEDEGKEIIKYRFKVLEMIRGNDGVLKDGELLISAATVDYYSNEVGYTPYIEGEDYLIFSGSREYKLLSYVYYVPLSDLPNACYYSGNNVLPHSFIKAFTETEDGYSSMFGDGFSPDMGKDAFIEAFKERLALSVTEAENAR